MGIQIMNEGQKMKSESKRKNREQLTVEKMIDIYCEDNHGLQNGRCESCEGLYRYSCKRIEECNFGENKSVCARCQIHCYRPDMREEIKKVMRYSGPKMPLKHPILTIYHLIDSKRNK